MKWLITILTIVLNTTGFMLETPDPCDSSPNSCDSEPVIKVPIPDTPKMEATSGVDSISVSWSGSTRAEAYSFYHNTSQPVGTSNRIDLANVTNYIFSDLDPSKTYYSVVGYNKKGSSSISAAASATPIPKAPARISATLGTGPNTITWESTNGVTGGYTLCYSTSTLVTTSDNAFAGSGNSYTNTGLAGGTSITAETDQSIVKIDIQITPDETLTAI